jgi:hypothetical protein
MLPISAWLLMLYRYEMWCYDLGCIAIDDLNKQLNDYWQ